MSGVNLARKFPFHEKQPYPLDRLRTRKRRNAPPKRPPTLHAGGAESLPGRLAVGLTRRYTLRYTLLPRMRAPLWRSSRQVAERPHRKEPEGRSWVNSPHDCDSSALPATGNVRRRTSFGRAGALKSCGSYPAGYRDTLHDGVLAAVGGPVGPSHFSRRRYVRKARARENTG